MDDDATANRDMLLILGCSGGDILKVTGRRETERQLKLQNEHCSQSRVSQLTMNIDQWVETG